MNFDGSFGFKFNRYAIYPISIGLLQFLGYNSISLFLVFGGILLSITSVYRSFIKSNFSFFLFLICSFIIGSIFCINNFPSERSLSVWGQFYLISFSLLFVEKKELLIDYFKKVIILIFILDILTNILLLSGFNLPWVELAEVRPGELLSRYPGIKNSALFSGTISFFALSFILEYKKGKKTKASMLILVLFNMILAGNYRFLVIATVIILLSLNVIRRKKIIIFSLFLFCVFVVIIATFYTMEQSGSNLLRFQLWQEAFKKLISNPMFGSGFFSPDIKNLTEANIDSLLSSGVTESTVLLIGINFGFPLMILFIFCILKTISRMNLYKEYSSELGIFFGLALDSFWAGSFENAISLSVFILSMYLINNKKSIYKNNVIVY